MNFLESLIRIWSDLEEEYNLGKVNVKEVDRVEFLKMLMLGESNVIEGTAKLLNLIEVKLTKNPEYREKIDKIKVLINNVRTYVMKNGLPDKIDNLNSFVTSTVPVKEIIKTPEDLSVMMNFYSTELCKPDFLPRLTLFETYGCLTSFCNFPSSKSQQPLYVVGDDITQKDKETFLVVTQEFDNVYDSNKYPNKKLFDAACVFCRIVLESNNFIPRTIIADKSIKECSMFDKSSEYLNAGMLDNIEVELYNINGEIVYVI